MKKIALSALFILTVLLFQNCKKSSTDDTTTTTTSALLAATVNGTAWTPDTVSAVITYTAATKTKVLAISGTIAQKQVNIVTTVSNATATADFPVTTYTVDANLNPLMTYATQQKNSAGAYVFVTQGTADASGGSIVLTTDDATNKKLTGTFYFTSRTITYDSKGNVVSVNASNIAGGTFTNLPYTFVSK